MSYTTHTLAYEYHPSAINRSRIIVFCRPRGRMGYPTVPRGGSAPVGGQGMVFGWRARPSSLINMHVERSIFRRTIPMCVYVRFYNGVVRKENPVPVPTFYWTRREQYGDDGFSSIFFTVSVLFRFCFCFSVLIRSSFKSECWEIKFCACTYFFMCSFIIIR